MIFTYTTLPMSFPGEGEVALVLAQDDVGYIVGTVCVRRAGTNVAEFARLFVVEEKRRTGIATALLEIAENVARKAGCTALSCMVNPGNHRARLFYSRRGFHPAYHFGDGDILMSRPIAPLPVVQAQTGFANTSASFCMGGEP